MTASVWYTESGLPYLGVDARTPERQKGSMVGTLVTEMSENNGRRPSDLLCHGKAFPSHFGTAVLVSHSTLQGGVRPQRCHHAVALRGSLVNTSVVCYFEGKVGEACSTSVFKLASQLSVSTSSLVFPMPVSPTVLEKPFISSLSLLPYTSKDCHVCHLRALDLCLLLPSLVQVIVTSSLGDLTYRSS